METARLNGIELAFEEIGGGSQVLLLIHGHPFDHTMCGRSSSHLPVWVGA